MYIGCTSYFLSQSLLSDGQYTTRVDVNHMFVT